jgi:hypothetical protein
VFPLIQVCKLVQPPSSTIIGYVKGPDWTKMGEMANGYSKYDSCFCRFSPLPVFKSGIHLLEIIIYYNQGALLIAAEKTHATHLNILLSQK